DQAEALFSANESDPESLKQAGQKVQEARAVLASIRAAHLAVIRQTELDNALSSFDVYAREKAKPTEITAFENMSRAALRLKEKASGEFDNILDEMKSTTWNVLWRDNNFVIGRFEFLRDQPFLFPDRKLHEALVERGLGAIQREDMNSLRTVVWDMYRAKASGSWSDEVHL